MSKIRFGARVMIVRPYHPKHGAIGVVTDITYEERGGESGPWCDVELEDGTMTSALAQELKRTDTLALDDALAALGLSQ